MQNQTVQLVREYMNKNINVLVIEDNDQYREFLSELLTVKGYSVSSACDGKQGMQLYHELRPDLVITDILMPKKDGFEVLAEIKKIKPMQPVIAISGYRKNKDMIFLDMMKSLGAAESLEKPIEINALISAIKNVLKK